MTEIKRRVLNIEEKATLIRRLENGESNTALAAESGIPHSTISTIYKNRRKINSLYEDNLLFMKRARPSNYKGIDEALLNWYHEKRGKIPMSGRVLQEKVNELARLKGKKDFECTSSWIQRFRTRHNIIFNSSCDRRERINRVRVPAKVVKVNKGYNPGDVLEIEIVEDKTSVLEPCSDEETSRTEEYPDEEQPESPLLGEALNAVETLERFIEFNKEYNTDGIQNALKELRLKMQNECDVKIENETNITDNFT